MINTLIACAQYMAIFKIVSSFLPITASLFPAQLKSSGQEFVWKLNPWKNIHWVVTRTGMRTTATTTKITRPQNPPVLVYQASWVHVGTPPPIPAHCISASLHFLSQLSRGLSLPPTLSSQPEGCVSIGDVTILWENQFLVVKHWSVSLTFTPNLMWDFNPNLATAAFDQIMRHFEKDFRLPAKL